MNDQNKERPVVSLEVSPAKRDPDGNGNDMVVCSPLEATEWSVYERRVDGTAVWLYSAPTQREAFDFVKKYPFTGPVFYKTPSIPAQPIPRTRGATVLDVLAGTTGDNGVFKATDENPDRWVLVITRPTGANSYTYVELGSFNQPDAAYHALTAALVLTVTSISYYVVAPALGTYNAVTHQRSYIVSREPNDGYGLFSVETDGGFSEALAVTPTLEGIPAIVKGTDLGGCLCFAMGPQGELTILSVLDDKLDAASISLLTA